MSDLPTEAFIVTMSGSWPVDVIVNDNPGIIAQRVERAVLQRVDGSGRTIADVTVWKVDLVNPRRVELVPEHTVAAELKERT